MSRNKKSHLVKQKIKHWPTPQEIKKKKKKRKRQHPGPRKQKEKKKKEHKKQILEIGTEREKKKTYWTKPHVQVHIGILVNKQIKLPPYSFLPILGRKLSSGPE